MNKDYVVGRALDGLGEMNAMLKRLMKETGTDDPKEAIRLYNSGTYYLVKLANISWMGTVTTAPTTEKFDARAKFRADSKEVKFSQIFCEFKNWYLAGYGEIVRLSTHHVLRYGNLVKTSYYSEILRELGGDDKSGITLEELYDLLRRQPNGENDGALLTNGAANICYVSGISGNLHAVYVQWIKNWGWSIHAFFITDFMTLLPGARVIARNH